MAKQYEDRAYHEQVARTYLHRDDPEELIAARARLATCCQGTCALARLGTMTHLGLIDAFINVSEELEMRIYGDQTA